MNANARWQEAISENLASASIPGYKKQDLSFEAVQSGVMSQANPDERVQFTMPRATPSINFAPGALRSTGVSTDVAIEGPGFFAVQMPDGSTSYTRDGEFHVSASGQLVTKQGYPVLGESGPIQFDQNLGGAISISDSGEMSQGSDIRGKLKVVGFDNPDQLNQLGGGLFAPPTGTQAKDLPVTKVRGKFLETSNATPATEMSTLIGVMRSFEANQRLMQIHGDRMARTITELGNPS